jgi:hypothetical protein
MTVQLLHKLSIRGVNGSEKLLRVIKVSLSFTSTYTWNKLITRTQSPTISLRIPSNSVCHSSTTLTPYHAHQHIGHLFMPTLSDTSTPKLTYSPICRRTYYQIIPIPPNSTRNTFHRRIRRSNGKRVSPFLSSISLFLSIPPQPGL